MSAHQINLDVKQSYIIDPIACIEIDKSLSFKTNHNTVTQIKEIGRLKLNKEQVQSLLSIYEKTTDSVAKREIISAIGRQRNSENIDLLIQLTNEPDPKLIIQILRALFVFKNNPKVMAIIKKLKKHKSELVNDFITTQTGIKNSKIKIKTPAIKSKYFNKIIPGDSLKSLKSIKHEIVDLTFTSPPYYNAKDYTIYNSYKEYLDFLTKVFKEVHRITAEGRFFILNTSPIIIPRASRQTSSKRYAIPFDMHPRLEKMGFEFIDDILWKKPDPSAKNRNGGFFQHRKPLGYKPNMTVEYLMVYRKKTNKLLDWNMRQYDPEIIEKSKVNEDYEMTQVWNIGASTNKIHPAIFPKKLATNVIKLYSYVNDLVLDPFAGIGTVGSACLDTNRHYILMEKNKSYIYEMENKLIKNGTVI